MIHQAYTCNALTLSQFISASCPGKQRGIHMLRRGLSQKLGIREEAIFPMAAGRMGLYLVLKSAGLAEGDEVVVPAYTCVVVTNAIKYTGARVVYADLAAGEVNPNLASITSSISPQTKAIVIPHNFGIPFEGIDVLRQNYPKIILVEDAAHSLSSCFRDGSMIGTKGDAAFFSFEFSKPVTSGLGGALVVNQDSLLANLSIAYESLNTLGRLGQFRHWLTLLAHLLTSYPYLVFLKGAAMRALRLLKLLGVTDEAELGGERPSYYPSRLSHWQARLVALQLRSYGKTEEHIRGLMKQYQEALEDIPGISLFGQAGALLLRFPVLLPFSRNSVPGRNLDQALRKRGVLPGEWFNQVVHPLGSYQYCYTAGSCTLGEAYAQQMINLPLGIHIKLSKRKIQGIRECFQQSLQQHLADQNALNRASNEIAR